MDFSKVIIVFSILYDDMFEELFRVDSYFTNDKAFYIILGGRSNVYRSGRNFVSNCSDWSIDLFDENTGIKTYNNGWAGF